MEDITNTLINGSCALGVLAYFIFKDKTYNDKLTETLTNLVRAVDALKDVVEKERSED